MAQALASFTSTSETRTRGSSEVVFSTRQEAANDVLGGSNRFSCLVGGTRSGKTFQIVRAILVRGLAAKESRHAILRFRANAARASISLDTLPAVASKCYPGLKLLEEKRQDGYWLLPNGSEIHVGGLDDKDRVEKILGTEYATIFLNEASQIPYSSYLVATTRLAQLVPGLTQRCYVDLNPVGKAHWTNKLFGEHRDPVSGQPLPDPENYRRAFLNPVDNAHNLTPEFLRDLASKPERYRKRFYEGVYLDEIENALWTYERLERTRVDIADIPENRRAKVVVAVDPSGAKGADDRAADEIGIIVACLGQDGHGYIIADRSLLAGPVQWARQAVNAFHEFKADCIVAEVNYGGEMVRSTIRTADSRVPVHIVHASRGKAIRAEPIANLFGEDAKDGRDEVPAKAHLAGKFSKLEEQLCAFSTAGYQGSDSPDHADAAIWALSHLMVKRQGTPAGSAPYAVRY